MKKRKRDARKKLTSIPVINRRLFRLASLVCRENANDTCEICGTKKGDLYKGTNKSQRVEAHHVMSRSNKNSPLKFDIRNLVCLCTNCHKFSRKSAHKHGLWFAKWFFKNRSKDADFILENDEIEVNLQDRSNLSYIENCLKHKEFMDY